MSALDWNERIPLSRRAAALLAVHAQTYVKQVEILIAAGDTFTPEFLEQVEEVKRAADILWGQVQDSPVPRPGDKRNSRAFAAYR